MTPLWHHSNVSFSGSTDTAPFLLGSDDAMPQDGTEQRWCGHLIPSLFMGSPGHPIHVSFRSDGSNGSLGFQFGYELDKMSECTFLLIVTNAHIINTFNSLRSSDAYLVGNLTSIYSGNGFVAWSAPSHYLNQCWNIVNWTMRISSW